MPPEDRIDVAVLRRQLIRPSSGWRRVDVVAETGSTNADLVARARTGEPAGAVLVTGHQSAGRGRRARTWTAPAGSGVAMSALVQPAIPSSQWTWLPLLAGVAVVEGLQDCAGVTARLKWPNDVLVGGRKICGILVERVDTPAGPMAVVGMGINVTLTEADLPIPSATSLALLGLPRVPATTEVAAAVLVRLGRTLTAWAADPVAARAAYLAVSDTIGRPVRVVLDSDASAGSGHRRTVTGTATGLDADGRLELVTATGPVTVGAGDVVHLR